MCGIIGIVGKSEVGSALYDALTVLQHRGQDAAGIATIDGDRIRLHKGSGLVRDVFTREAMPAASWPRCWSTVSASYSADATSDFPTMPMIPHMGLGRSDQADEGLDGGAGFAFCGSTGLARFSTGSRYFATSCGKRSPSQRAPISKFGNKRD